MRLVEEVENQCVEELSERVQVGEVDGGLVQSMEQVESQCDRGAKKPTEKEEKKN